MTDWSSGYVADIDYTYGYYTELNPLRANLAFLSNNFRPNKIKTACELGFGQGLSTNFHAAASDIQWFGTDFNPTQASFAQDLAEAAGSGAELLDLSFEEYCAKKDLPDFDYICLHGIWSWISDANRKIIVEFIRRKLKVGGLLYISFNTLPGWASFAPIRHLMTQHSEVIGSEGSGIVNRIDNALDFATKLIYTNPLFAKANPHVQQRLQKMQSQNRHYLAHEFFNRDWHPMHFSTMAEWLEPSKVGFACSANYLDYIDNINFTSDQMKFMDEIPDRMLKESARDFMVNQTFRKDYWVKGYRRVASLDRAELLSTQRIVLIVQPDDVSLTIKGGQGDATLSEEIYKPIVEVLADHKIWALGDLLRAVQKINSQIDFSQVVQAASVLAATGAVTPANNDDVIEKSKAKTDAINKAIIERARSSAEIVNLCSPVTGGGVPANRFYQLFLSSMRSGRNKKEEWVQEIWNLLKMQRQLLIKDNKTLETEEENIAEITRLAEEFESKRLPVYQALQMV